MENRLFTLIGYHLESAILFRKPVPMERIKISIVEVDSGEDKITSFAVLFKLIESLEESEDSFENEIKFRVIFKINDDSMFLKFNDYFSGNDKDKSKNDSHGNDILAAMVAYIFPYIRQQLNSMTQDHAGPITLPVIDSRNLVAGLDLVLNKSS